MCHGEGGHVLSSPVVPNLTLQREESEEWESDGGEGSHAQGTACVGLVSTYHLPAPTRL